MVLIVVVGINVNNCEEENKNSDYENNIYEEMIKIMLKHNAQYSKFNKQNQIEEIYKSEKKCKLAASSPIPIPKQNVK
jgi:hypothetical protein